MPFKFSHICDLLDSLERIETRDPPFLPLKRREAIRLAVQTWFHQHRIEIDNDDSNKLHNGNRTGRKRSAILSCLFPRRRPDRVFNLQAARLTKIVGRCLRLNAGKLAELQGWKYPRNGDMGTCVERVLKDSDIEPRPGVAQVEEVDAVLDELAGRCRFSSLELRENENRSGRKRKRYGGSSQEEQRLGAAVPEEILRPIYLKMRSSEAKWLTRMVLKDFGPVVLDDEDDTTGQLVMRHIHFLMPSLLKFQDDLRAAIDLLSGPLRCYPSRTDPQSEKLHAAAAAAHLRPKVGLKVGNSAFDKARSIRHCVRMAGKSRWSVERKYDGEFCEIHVDLSKDETPDSNIIKIFSKSGKESTDDRLGVQEALKRCLRLGQSDCKIKQKCILLAEMVAYSDIEKRILEFHKIRKLVTRSGRRLGIAQDSQKHEYEHLMLVFFDILLLDNEPLMLKAQEDRRQRLEEIVMTVKGRAVTAESSIINFRNADAPEILKEHFLSSISSCHEGLVLKPCQSPYVNFAAFATPVGEKDQQILSFEKKRFIKLKKDFIPGLGDTADLIVIGGSYNAQKSFQHRLPGLEFTSFYLACLDDARGFRRGIGKCPVFKVVGVINESVCIPKPCMTALNDTSRFMAVDYHHHNDKNSPALANPPFNISFATPELSRSMQKVFPEPIICEVLGSGFEKPSGSNTYMLRHPRILKVHTGPDADRSWTDAVSFEELQDMAKWSLKIKNINYGEGEGDIEDEMQEMKALIERSMKDERSAGMHSVNSQDTVATTITTTTAATTCNVDAITSQSLNLVNENDNSIAGGDVNVEKEKRHSTGMYSIAYALNGDRNSNSYDNITSKTAKETQFYTGASSTRHKAQECSLPTPPISSISSEGSSGQITEQTNDSLKTVQIFRTLPLPPISKAITKPSTGQEPPGSEEEDELDESFHTPPTITHCTGSTTTATTTAAMATASQSFMNDKTEDIKAKSPANTKKRNQSHSGLRSVSDGRPRLDSKLPALQSRRVGLEYMSEKAYDPFAKVLSSVKSGIKGSVFDFGSVTFQGCNARENDAHDWQEHQHHRGTMENDRTHRNDESNKINSSSRRSSSINSTDIARNNNDGDILNINKSTNHVDAEVFEDIVRKRSNHPLKLTKSDKSHCSHRLQHGHSNHEKMKINRYTRKLTKSISLSSSSSSNTRKCLCLDPPPPTLNLQNTTIHLSTSSLTPNRRSQLRTLLARKHGSAIVIDDLKYWSRQYSEAASGSGSESESDNEEEVININIYIDQDKDIQEEDNDSSDDDDEVVPESQSHPGLTKVILVDAAAATLSSPSSPPQRSPEQVIRPVVRELGRADISSSSSSSSKSREEHVYIWDWRVLRGLMGGATTGATDAVDAAGAGATFKGGKTKNNNNNHNKNNNNKDSNTNSSNINPYYIGKLIYPRGRRHRRRGHRNRNRNHNRKLQKSKKSSSLSSSFSSSLANFVFERHRCFFL